MLRIKLKVMKVGANNLIKIKLKTNKKINQKLKQKVKVLKMTRLKKIINILCQTKRPKEVR